MAAEDNEEVVQKTRQNVEFIGKVGGILQSKVFTFEPTNQSGC